jgi:hypothetical protein
MKPALQSFASEENWCGGHYQLEVDLGSPSDERLAGALQALWSHPSLEGCYLNRGQELKDQPRVDPAQHSGEGHLYGTATLPGGARVPCGTYVCRLQDEEDGPVVRDLFSLYVPLGSASRAYPVGAYPFSDIDRAAEWRVPLDRWLVDLGRFVYERVRFQLALIGFEVDFPNVSAATIQRNGLPAERYDGFLWRVGDQLEWYPPTNFELIRVSGPKETTPSSSPRT